MNAEACILKDGKCLITGDDGGICDQQLHRAIPEGSGLRARPCGRDGLIFAEGKKFLYHVRD